METRFCNMAMFPENAIVKVCDLSGLGVWCKNNTYSVSSELLTIAVKKIEKVINSESEWYLIEVLLKDKINADRFNKYFAEVIQYVDDTNTGYTGDKKDIQQLSS